MALVDFNVQRLERDQHTFDGGKYGIDVRSGLLTTIGNIRAPVVYSLVGNIYKTVIPRLNNERTTDASDPFNYWSLIGLFGLDYPLYLLPMVVETMREQTTSRTEYRDRLVLYKGDTDGIKIPGGLPFDEVKIENTVYIAGTPDDSLDDFVQKWSQGFHCLPPAIGQQIEYPGVNGKRVLTARWLHPYVEERRGQEPLYSYTGAKISALIEWPKVINPQPFIELKCRIIPALAIHKEDVSFTDRASGHISHISLSRGSEQHVDYEQPTIQEGYFSYQGKKLTTQKKGE